MRMPPTTPRGGSALALATLLVALALLNAALTFHNVWPTPAVEWRGEWSVEVALLVLEATLNTHERYPIGPPLMKPVVLGASARARLRRSDFGMTYGVANGLVGDEVELLVELEARRQ